MDDQAGFHLLERIRAENPDLPLLNLSTEEANRTRAERLPAVFINKSSPMLNAEIHSFFLQYLGFGDFIFRDPDGPRDRPGLQPARHGAPAADRSGGVRGLPRAAQPLLHLVHGPLRGHARLQTQAGEGQRLRRASRRSAATSCAASTNGARGIQRGIITEMAQGRFDPDADFIKIGRGSLGGKARGLAFASTLLKENPELHRRFEGGGHPRPQDAWPSAPRASTPSRPKTA